MKKVFVMLLCTVMTLSCTACAGTSAHNAGNQASVTSTPVNPSVDFNAPIESSQPEAEPDCTDGTVRISFAPVLVDLFARGEKVTVLGLDKNYYVISYEGDVAKIEQDLLRLDTQEPYQSWTGYAVGNAPVYDSFLLNGEAQLNLPQNTEVSVLDVAGGVYVVEVDGQIAYMDVNSIRTYPIRTQGPSQGAESGPTDGSDIHLTASFGVNGTYMLLTARSYPVSATVLVDKTPVILCFHERGDNERLVLEDGIVKTDGDYCFIRVDGHTRMMNRIYLAASEDEPYTAWDGYACYNCVAFTDYSCTVELARLTTNTAIHVIDEVGGVYLVDNNGTVAYIRADLVSRSFISPPSASRSSGGTAEWTAPAL